MDSKDVSTGQASKAEQTFLPLVIWEPTPFEIVKDMLELAQVGPEDVVYDLGCGDARILIMAVKEYGAKKAVGYEIKQDLYEKSTQEIQSQNLQDRITLIRDDLFNADLSEASVITLFLSIAANECLRPKLEREAKPSARIVSYVHLMNTWQANSTELGPGDRLYLYVVPQAFQVMPDQP
ncbi:methyltransferase domain-containing protein [Chloroflexota bacterium]